MCDVKCYAFVFLMAEKKSTVAKSRRQRISNGSLVLKWTSCRWNEKKKKSKTVYFLYDRRCMSVVSPTLKSFRLHDRSRFAYAIWVDLPTLKSFRLHFENILGRWMTLREKPNIRARIRSNMDRRTPRTPQCSDVFDFGWLEIHLEYSISIRPVFPYSNWILSCMTRSVRYIIWDTFW